MTPNRIPTKQLIRGVEIIAAAFQIPLSSVELLND